MGMERNKIEEFEAQILNNKKAGKQSDGDESLEELFEELERDDAFIYKYREQRLEEISKQLKEVKKNIYDHEYGFLTTISDEHNLITMTTKVPKIVIHFFLETFKKCQILDDQLKIIAEKHLQVKFVRINVQDCPFLIEKLKIKILPCVISYKDGIEVDRSVGFSKFGNHADKVHVKDIERWLINTGLISEPHSKLQITNKKEYSNNNYNSIYI